MTRLLCSVLAAALCWTAFILTDSATVFLSATPQAAATRALVWDEKAGVLHAVDPESGRRLNSASIPPGGILPSHDGSRLVVFWTEPRTAIEHATILDRHSLRTIGDVLLGTVCTDRFQTSDGQYLAVICFASGKNRKDPSTQHLLGIDLANGTLTGRLPIAGGASLVDGGNGRVVIVSSRTQSEPVNSILAATLPSLKDLLRLDLPCSGSAGHELLSADKRRLFVRCDAQRPLPKGTPAIPSSMMIVDLERLAAPRVVPLGDTVFGGSGFTDNRFIYIASNANDLRADVEPALVVFSTETESVTDRIALVRDSSPVYTFARVRMSDAASDGTRLMRSGSRLLLIRDGRVMSTTDLPGQSVFARFTESPDRRRVYVTRERTIVALDASTGTPAWTNTLKDEGLLTVSPDGTRALTRQQDDVTVVDLANGNTLAEFKASTKGGRAGLFWKNLGLSFISGVTVNNSIATDVAFSATTRRALVLGTTGEAILVDLADGRTIARLPDRAAALVALPESPLALVLSPRQVIVFDMLAAKDVQKLSFADGPSDWAPRLALSKDRTRLAVAAGSTVYFLEAVSGRIVSRADGLGRIASAMFID